MVVELVRVYKSKEQTRIRGVMPRHMDKSING